MANKTTGQIKPNKATVTVGPAITGFARVINAGTKFGTSDPEYHLQIQFDPNTTEGKASIEMITAAHEANVAYEKAQRGDVKDIVDYGVPLVTVDTSETTTSGNPKNPDSFSNGMIKITGKTVFEPGVFGSLTPGDGGNSDLRGTMTNEIPVGSTVKVRLCLMSYYQPGNAKAGSKPIVGSSVKLQAVKILKIATRSAFEADESAEVLSFDGATSSEATTEAESEFPF